MTQPYPSTHTADIKHAKASAATRLRSSRLVWIDSRNSWITGKREVPPKRRVADDSGVNDDNGPPRSRSGRSGYDGRRTRGNELVVYGSM